MTSPTPPAVSEAMREAVAPRVAEALAAFQKRYGYHRPVIEELLIDFGEILASLTGAEIARLTGERDVAEQRVTNLAAALASARRARGEQEKRANEADDRRVSLEKDRIHHAFSVEVQEHRQQAYEGGWSDGYAEGFAKPNARAEAAEAETARLRAALEEIAKGAPVTEPHPWDGELDTVCWNIAQIARAALTSREKTDA